MIGKILKYEHTDGNYFVEVTEYPDRDISFSGRILFTTFRHHTVGEISTNFAKDSFTIVEKTKETVLAFNYSIGTILMLKDDQEIVIGLVIDNYQLLILQSTIKDKYEVYKIYINNNIEEWEIIDCKLKIVQNGKY